MQVFHGKIWHRAPSSRKLSLSSVVMETADMLSRHPVHALAVALIRAHLTYLCAALWQNLRSLIAGSVCPCFGIFGTSDVNGPDIQKIFSKYFWLNEWVNKTTAFRVVWYRGKNRGFGVKNHLGSNLISVSIFVKCVTLGKSQLCLKPSFFNCEMSLI